MQRRIIKGLHCGRLSAEPTVADSGRGAGRTFFSFGKIAYSKQARTPTRLQSPSSLSASQSQRRGGAPSISRLLLANRGAAIFLLQGLVPSRIWLYGLFMGWDREARGKGLRPAGVACSHQPTAMKP